MIPSEYVSLGALLISALSLIRAFSKDSKGNAAELTTVIVKLENIGNDITEIKKDIRSVRAEIREHSERIAKMEQRMDALEEIVKIYHPKNTPEK